MGMGLGMGLGMNGMGMAAGAWVGGPSSTGVGLGMGQGMRGLGVAACARLLFARGVRAECSAACGRYNNPGAGSQAGWVALGPCAMATAGRV